MKVDEGALSFAALFLSQDLARQKIHLPFELTVTDAADGKWFARFDRSENGKLHIQEAWPLPALTYPLDFEFSSLATGKHHRVRVLSGFGDCPECEEMN